MALMRRSMSLMAVFLLTLVAVTPVDASLIGRTAHCEIQSANADWACDRNSSLVGPGTEFTLSFGEFGSVFSVDIGSSSLRLTMINAGININLLADELLIVSGLRGVLDAMLASSSVVGLGASDVSFTERSVSLNLASTRWTPGDEALISVAVAPARIPEPGTAALICTALLVLLFSRVRMQHQRYPARLRSR